MDVVVNRIYLPVLPVIGGVLVLGSGIGAFINAKGLPDKSSNAIIRIAIISALSCGVALFIDGEISHYIIFKDDSLLSSLPVFLFYEMLTFGIPSLLAFLLVLYKLRKRALQALKAEFIEFPTAYWLSALFSVGQFVFSVFALSYSNDRVLTAAILGTAPLLGVLTDKKQRTISQKRYDILFSFITLIGIILATAYAFL
jgi:uncharacterized membrane protein